MKPAAFLTVLVAALAMMVPVAAPRAQVLAIATDQSPIGLDPHIATSFASLLVTGTIFEGLTAIDGKLAVVPALAQSWTVDDDGRTYRFVLRSGARFHNGRAVTPADVAASIARVRDPRTGSPYASRFAVIADVQPDGAEAVKVMLTQPSAPLLAQLASLAIVPPEAVADLAHNPIGTGPFRFRQWVPDAFVALDRNPAYWEAGLPKLSGLRFDIVPDAATRQGGLVNGTYSMLPSLDAATASALAGQPQLRVLRTQDLAYSLVGLNTARPPFDKPDVREALNVGIDRADLIRVAYGGRAVPGGPLSPALTHWALPASAFPCYTPDPERARRLLTGAGLTLPVKLRLNVLGSLQQVVEVAQVVQAQLKKAGFDVSLDVQDQARFIADWRAGNFQGFVSLNGGGPDPDDYLGRTFTTRGTTNVFRFSDPAIDTLLDEARGSSDAALRKKDYDDVQRALACTGPVAYLAYGTLFTAVRQDVQGYESNATRSLRGLRSAFVQAP